MAHGALIVFEGTEGVGKTTQVQRLVAMLHAGGVPCVHLREPGGTSLGEAIRKLLLDPSRELSSATEALLFMASRAQLMMERVQPALDEGSVVVLDRFFLSTYAYQIAGRGLDESLVRAANQLAVGPIVPDMTLVLDLPPDVGMERADRRSARDRIEEAGDAFHRRVGAAFTSYLTPEWQRAHPETGPLTRIDASGSEDDVFARVANALATWRPHTFVVFAPDNTSNV